LYTGYFTSDNEPDGIENATHNTFAKLKCIYSEIFLINNCQCQNEVKNHTVFGHMDQLYNNLTPNHS
jgi:hypothetical protein